MQAITMGIYRRFWKMITQPDRREQMLMARAATAVRTVAAQGDQRKDML